MADSRESGPHERRKSSSIVQGQSRLAEADHRVLQSVPLHQISQIVTGVYIFMGHCGNFEFNTIVNRQPV